MSDDKEIQIIEKPEDSPFYEKVYFWIFLCIWILTVGLGVFVWRGASEKTLIDVLSLASSISSIILAALAIVYSYIQTSKQGEAERHMQYTLQKIDKRLDSLNNLNHQLVEYVKTAGQYIDELKHMSSSLNMIREETTEVLSFMKENTENFEKITKERTDTPNEEEFEAIKEQQKVIQHSLLSLNRKLEKNLRSASDNITVSKNLEKIRIMNFVRRRIHSLYENVRDTTELDSMVKMLVEEVSERYEISIIEARDLVKRELVGTRVPEHIARRGTE